MVTYSFHPVHLADTCHLEISCYLPFISVLFIFTAVSFDGFIQDHACYFIMLRFGFGGVFQYMEKRVRGNVNQDAQLGVTRLPLKWGIITERLGEGQASANLARLDTLKIRSLKQADFNSWISFSYAALCLLAVLQGFC